MLVIEFVNHIESLAVDYGKVWRVGAWGVNDSPRFCSGTPNVLTPFEWRRYLAPPLAIGERIRLFFLPTLPAQRKHPRLLSSKTPRNLKA